MRVPSSNTETACSLAAFELFQTIKESERLSIERHCTQRVWPAGAMIVVGHATSSANVYFVVAGRCQVLTRIPGRNRDVVLDEVGPGSFFGEMAAIDGEPRSAAVVAVERSQIVEMTTATFTQLLTDHPPAALVVMRRMSEVIRQADSAIMDLSGLHAQARVCAELLRRARTGRGLPPDVGAIAPIPRHGDIAARACTARETVTRVLSDLMHRKLIQREPQRLLLNSIAALTQISAADNSRSAPAAPIIESK